VSPPSVEARHGTARHPLGEGAANQLTRPFGAASAFTVTWHRHNENV